MRISFLCSKLKLTILPAVILTLLMTSSSYGDLPVSNQWQSIGPNGKSIAVSPNFAMDHIIYAGSQTGGVLKSPDGGTSWTPVNNGIGNMNIWAIGVSAGYLSDHTVFAATDGGVFKSTNEGASWNPVFNGIGPQSIHSLALSPNYMYDQTIFAGTWGSGLYKSTDGGTTWIPYQSGISEPFIASLALSPGYATDQAIYAGTWNNGVFKSTDGGSSWNSVGINYSHTMHALALSPAYTTDRTVYVGIGGGGGVMRSTNGGNSWEPINNGLSNLNILSLALSPGFADDPTPPGNPGDKTLFVGTLGGGTFRSTNGGVSWEQLNNGLTNLNVWALAASPAFKADRTIFAGTDGGLFKLTSTLAVPTVSASPVGLAFGNMPINSSPVELSITLGNSGNASLAVNSINLYGADTSQFTVSSYSSCGSPTPYLAPGTSCSLNVQFAPTTAGQKNAYLQIDSNDPVTPNLLVNLTGAGVTGLNPAWDVNSVNPQLTYAIDWPAAEHGMVYYRSYLNIAGTYYFIRGSNQGSWNGQDYIGCGLQRCDQLTGTPLYNIDNVTPLDPDMTGLAGQPINLYLNWPLPAGNGGTINLPQSGQTTCYGITGAVVSCIGTGQDGDTKAGVAWPNPRFSNNGDQTMTDNLTKLVWASNGNLMPSRDPGFDNDVRCFYEICDGPNDGAVSWQNALNYIAKLNAEHYLGYSDWRLPNSNELASMVNKEQGNQASFLNALGFLNAQPRWYWSSTTAIDYDAAWVVSMNDGQVGFNSMDSIKSGYYGFHLAWPVRGGNGSPGASIGSLPKTGQTTSYAAGDDGDLQLGVALPTLRFINNGDQTVTDTLTGLNWSKDAMTPGPSLCNPGTVKTWYEALDHIKCLNNNGYLGKNNWRLPNSNELVSLINKQYGNQADLLNSLGLDNVQPSLYWSSTTAANDTGLAWGVEMYGGRLYNNSGNKNWGGYVWPIRDGESNDTTPPITTASRLSGIYSTPQTVIFTANEPATIYYTTNGAEPTTASPVYTAPISITATTTLKFFAQDTSDNSEPVKTEVYTLQPTFSEPPYYPLGISLNGNGSGTVEIMPNPQGESCSTSCTRIFADKTVVTITPEASVGSFFSGWVGCDSVSGNLCTVALDGAKNISAHFTAGTSPIKPAVAAGMANTLIMKNNGTVWRWGGLPAGGPVPQQLTELVDSVAISAGTEHSVAITSEGRVRIWGANSRGQLGSGLAGPRSEITGLTDIIALAAGHWHTAAVRADGTVWSFGDNSDGCLGDGTTSLRGDLVQAAGLTGVKAVAASHSTLALKTDGTVWSWGRNDYGQLGDGTSTQRSTPAQITGLSNIVSVASSNSHSLALSAIGTVFGWGDGYGPYPYSLTGLSNVVAIAAGSYSSLALKADGSVWEWHGNNTPVQVSGLSDITAIAASDHAVVMKSDGTIWGWGNNFVGQLGDGTLTFSSTPVKATTGTTSNYPLTIAVSGNGTVYTPASPPCTGICTHWLPEGTIALSPSPDSGHIFTGWSGCSSVVGSTCVVTMSGGQYITANFAPNIPYTLTAYRIGSGSGQVTSFSPDTRINLTDQTSSSAQYAAGTTVTLTASADSGSSFSGWRGACSGTAPCTVQLGGDTSVSAVFSSTTTGNPGNVKLNDQFFTLLQDAYTALLSGSSAVIFANALSVKENLVFDRNIAVTLKGGYDNSFGTSSGLTVLRGSLTITNGSVIMENIVIQ